MVIDRPGAHERYFFEAEPHFVLGPFDPPGAGFEDQAGVGLGFRGTFEIVDNGFVRSINNTVGIGVGVDYARFNGRGCVVRVDPVGPRRRECTEFGDRAINVLWLPVVMQWNFFISRNWSVFGEPGIAFRFDNNNIEEDLHFNIDPFVLYLGGRFHFTDRITLTMRVGYPTFSVGVSFLL